MLFGAEMPWMSPSSTPVHRGTQPAWRMNQGVKEPGNGLRLGRDRSGPRRPGAEGLGGRAWRRGAQAAVSAEGGMEVSLGAKGATTSRVCPSQSFWTHLHSHPASFGGILAHLTSPLAFPVSRNPPSVRDTPSSLPFPSTLPRGHIRISRSVHIHVLVPQLLCKLYRVLLCIGCGIMG